MATLIYTLRTLALKTHHLASFGLFLNSSLGCLPLPFDISTMTVVTCFIAAAIGKIYKIRAEKLSKLEAPRLSK